jgi:hypothetical protein
LYGARSEAEHPKCCPETVVLQEESVMFRLGGAAGQWATRELFEQRRNIRSVARKRDQELIIRLWG